MVALVLQVNTSRAPSLVTNPAATPAALEPKVLELTTASPLGVKRDIQSPEGEAVMTLTPAAQPAPRVVASIPDTLAVP